MDQNTRLIINARYILNVKGLKSVVAGKYARVRSRRVVVDEWADGQPVQNLRNKIDN